MTTYRTLIEPAELQAQLGASDWVLIDCRFDLADPKAGRLAYQRGHIPSAQYAHLDENLAGPVAPTTGRHPLPEAERFAGQLGRWGIDAAVQVIAYDDSNGATAARLWWMLRWLGHERVAVLDGGFKAWIAAGYPVETLAVTAQPRIFQPRTRAGAWLTTDQVARGLASEDLVLVDARAAERFAGRSEPIDPVAGHVPGARNHPFARNLAADGRWLPAAELRRRWFATLDGALPVQTVCMCGSGVTACHDLLALEIAGFVGARLYAGSWSEWIRDPARKIASGG